DYYCHSTDSSRNHLF
nr:immunoglobulin light chain junction region [Macaca mulatta]